jgi:hypothetical protein
MEGWPVIRSVQVVRDIGYGVGLSQLTDFSPGADYPFPFHAHTQSKYLSCVDHSFTENATRCVASHPSLAAAVVVWVRALYLSTDTDIYSRLIRALWAERKAGCSAQVVGV